MWVRRRISRMMETRLSSSADYPAIGELYTLLNPGRPVTAVDLLEADRGRDPKYQMQRWVAVSDHRVVGVGSYFQREWFYHPRKFRISVLVHPDYRRRGVGSALYAQILDGLNSLDPIALICDTYADCHESIRFLEGRGFEIFIRDRTLRLNLDSFDGSAYDDYETPLLAQGIRLKSAAELAGDPDRDQKLYALDQIITTDAPQHEYAPERSLAEYIDFAITGSSALPDALSVAVHGDDYIGFTQVMDGGDRTLYQLLTGVRPEYRRRHIALALKLRTIAYAQARQFRAIITNTDPSNRPMLALNEQLGFVGQSDQLFFRKEIGKELPAEQ